MTALTSANTTDADAVKCRLCRCKLDSGESDDFERELCQSCLSRPEAKRLSPTSSAQPNGRRPTAPAREFTPAECSLISKVSGYMPAEQLLALLNERLICDLGPDAKRYTMAQLRREIGESTPPTDDWDWPSLRRLVLKARRDGTLKEITEQVIHDFAVVFSLNSKQLLIVKDILLQAKED